MSQLTSEQVAIVNCDAKVLAVDAGAGTGKTSTLVTFAQARPRRRILYIAFNKSVATEAKTRFPENVDCRTGHSLAYGPVGSQYRAKLGNVPVYMVQQYLGCSTAGAKAALTAVQSWLCSVDEHIEAKHVEGAEAIEPEEVDMVVHHANKLWQEMKDRRSKMAMPHDGYLKIWAMQRPRLSYDIILLDEAQDTNPLTLDFVMAQQGHAQIVLVGDRHQGIYGFRKALNAMEAVAADQRLALTQSFRYGQRIADVATALLQTFKGEEKPLKGRPDIDVKWSVDRKLHYCIIGRTNAGLFSSCANFLMERPSERLYFVGGFDGYMFGKVLDAYFLWAGRRSEIKDAGISRFPTYKDFATYGQEAGDTEVKSLCRIVEDYKHKVPAIYNAVKAAETRDESNAAITITTAHRAKGLEWEQVQLNDDFVELPPDEDEDLEEINLLYVGVTRAIHSIVLPLNLRGWLEEIGFDLGSEAVVEAEQANDPVDIPVEEIRWQRDRLIKAILDAATKAGLYHGEPLVSGADVVDLCGALANRCLQSEAKALPQH